MMDRGRDPGEPRGSWPAETSPFTQTVNHLDDLSRAKEGVRDPDDGLPFA